MGYWFRCFNTWVDCISTYFEMVTYFEEGYFEAVINSSPAKRRRSNDVAVR